jgi:hypothetical protein
MISDIPRCVRDGGGLLIPDCTVTADETWVCHFNWRQKGGQGMVLAGHAHTCFSLAQGCRSGWRLCVKTGFGNKLEYVLFS